MSNLSEAQIKSFWASVPLIAANSKFLRFNTV